MADICHTCRRCYNLCPSFDVLFRALDRPDVDGEADRARGGGPRATSPISATSASSAFRTVPTTRRTAGTSTFPRVVFRDRAARVKQRGKPGLRERILSSADAVGKIAVGGRARRQLREREPLARASLMEKTLGVHRDRLLPSCAPETLRVLVGEARRRDAAL